MKAKSYRRWLGTVLLLMLCAAGAARAIVPTGDKSAAILYYKSLPKEIGYSTSDAILQTTLDNVAEYLGYPGLSGQFLQDQSPSLLNDPKQLAAALPGLGFVPGAGDILATRFFAPKITNIKVPESSRQLGWRKLVRLRSRLSSNGRANHISSGIILFNFFTAPDQSPFQPGAESVNTQVMLITDSAAVPKGDATGPATLYWLDYSKLSPPDNGILSLALTASFDADELQKDVNGNNQYFVPHGCNACHGASDRRAMVNYLDTDHWFDRLDNDFTQLKASNLPLLVDATSNDTKSADFQRAFDVIRQFNAEADAQASGAQKKHDEVLASHKWLELHASSYEHVPPVQRAFGDEPRWSANDPTAVRALASLNQYCFRCHGSINFSVFNLSSLKARPASLRAAINPSPDLVKNNPDYRKMPPDRPLPDADRDLILQVLFGGNP